MAAIVDGIGAMQRDLVAAATDARHARAGVHRVSDDMAAQFVGLRNDMASRDVARAIEKKSDRRWMVGTALSCAALIVAAVGILVGAL